MLAIIVPYYKIDFFKETLISLANQSNKNFKVYIGNDASPDDPTRLINNYLTDVNKVYHKFSQNIGREDLTQQWARCIELVNNENWIMILGDDDVLGADVVEAFYQHCELFNGKTDVIRFSSQIISEDSKLVSKIYSHPIWEKAEDSYFKKFIGLSRSSLSEYIFSKEVYKNKGFQSYPLAWYSDDRAWFDFSEGKNIYSINEATVYVRNSSINISGRTDNLYEKELAKKQFLTYLIIEKLSLFNLEARLKLIREYEKVLVSSGAYTLSYKFKLGQLYLQNYGYYEFKKFLKRTINIGF
jgi:hypothetical protein